MARPSPGLTKKGKAPISTVLIVVLIVLFWPVGLVLLVLRLKDRRAKVRQNGAILIGTGIFFLLVAASYISSAPSREDPPGPSELAISLVILLGVAVLLLWKGLRGRKDGRRFERYATLIGRQHVVDIDTLASLYPASYDQTVADLQRMEYEGYFYDDAQIDFSGRRLTIGYWEVTPPPARAAGPAPASPQPPPPPPPPQPRTVKCPGCGAMNTIQPGGRAECEYCGSALL